MVYQLIYPLAKYFSSLNITRYITFRAGCAFVTAFILVALFWKFTIKKLRQLKVEETINMYGHKQLSSLFEGKKGTPTMGGVLILFALVLATLLWARWDNLYVWCVLATVISLGILGFIDDFLKLKKGKGLSRSVKLYFQIFIGLLLGFFVVASKLNTVLTFPFFKQFIIDLGYFYIFWATLVIVAASNAVNFTDGLDGLAIGGLIVNFLIFSFLSYVVGHAYFSQYLFIPYVRDAGELAVFCFAAVGAGLGFLWFNCHPAEVFMGDIGALSLGGALGIIALLIKKEFLLFISGGLFVIEALSVILQMFSLKLRGKRIFRAAPFHHHLQLLGWPESKVIVRLWIIAILCAVFSLLTLKIR